MTEITTSLNRLIIDAIEDALFHLHTGLPAKVLSFDPDTQSCSVQVLLERYFLDADGVPTIAAYPELQGIPVEFFNFGGWSIVAAPRVDDIVYLSFCERSLDRWKDAPVGDSVDPKLNHRHDITDAIARPGPRPRQAALPVDGDNLVLRNEAGTTTITLSASKVTVNGAQVALGGLPATHAGVHGDVLAAILAVVSTYITAVAAATVPLIPDAQKLQGINAAAAIAGPALIALLAQPPGPTGLLSAKVVLE